MLCTSLTRSVTPVSAIQLFRCAFVSATNGSHEFIIRVPDSARALLDAPLPAAGVAGTDSETGGPRNASGAAASGLGTSAQAREAAAGRRQPIGITGTGTLGALAPTAGGGLRLTAFMVHASFSKSHAENDR